MKKLLLVFAAASAMSGVVSAATVDCTQAVAGTAGFGIPASPNVLQNYSTPTSMPFSCMSGGLTFSNFFAANAGGVPNPQVNLTAVTSDPTNGVVLQFNPNLSAPAGSPAVDIDLGFQVTATSGLINSVDLALLGVGGTISEVACSTPFTSANGVTTGPFATCGANTLASLANTSNAPNVVRSIAPVSNLYIFKDINVNPANAGGGAAALTTVQQSFNSTAPTTVPEPISMVLMGSGLLGLGLVRRRNRAS